MNTYIVNIIVHRPTFLQLEIDAESPTAAGQRADALCDEHIGLKHIAEFPELLGESEGTYDMHEILDIEDVSK